MKFMTTKKGHDVVLLGKDNNTNALYLVLKSRLPIADTHVDKGGEIISMDITYSDGLNVYQATALPWVPEDNRWAPLHDDDEVILTAISVTPSLNDKVTGTTIALGVVTSYAELLELLAQY